MFTCTNNTRDHTDANAYIIVYYISFYVVLSFYIVLLHQYHPKTAVPQ